jgi:hypothetical protein
LTHPFWDILEMQRFVAKNASGCNGPGRGAAHGRAKIRVEILRRRATVMQKPRAKQSKCITHRDANFGAP